MQARTLIEHEKKRDTGETDSSYSIPGLTYGEYNDLGKARCLINLRGSETEKNHILFQEKP